MILSVFFTYDPILPSWSVIELEANITLILDHEINECWNMKSMNEWLNQLINKQASQSTHPQNNQAATPTDQSTYKLTNQLTFQSKNKEANNM